MFEPTKPVAHTGEPDKPSVVVTDTEVAIEDDATSILTRYIPQKSIQNARPAAVNSCINEIFEARFRERPDAPAVCAWDGSYTYRELDDQSSALAHKLRHQGVKAEVLVALLFEKSKFSVVAMHAVVKAGGAFLLWDPSLPVARLRGMFAESGARFVLASAAYAQMASEISEDFSVVDDAHIPPYNASLLPPGTQPENALCSVFTSGSTGKPKGFLMDHRALCTCALGFGELLGLDGASRLIQFSSNTFDLATFEHLLPFLFGACLCIASEEERKGDLNRALCKYRITHAILTPTVTRLLEPQHLTALRVLVMVGEAAGREDIRRWASSVKLLNGYSPAEAGCITIVNPVLQENHPNKIGFPIAVVPWVVDPDDHNRLVPAGEVGELVIQGHTLARGYFGRPDESKSAFIQAPPWVHQFGCESYGRLYRTGDLVRFDTDDGSLLIIGRKDSQVKIHGQRLELGEIEHALQQFFPPPQVVVVELLMVENREPALVGFVCQPGNPKDIPAGQQSKEDRLFLVPDDQFCADAQTALASTRDILPSYMVPSDLLLISHLPMVPSGKTDRRWIRMRAVDLAPDERRQYSSVLGKSRDRPVNQLEESLLGLWATSLKLAPSQIGVMDNFFHLGGGSLEAIHLAAEARNIGFPELSSATVFKCPTIRKMAGMLEATVVSAQQPDAPISSSFQLESSLVAELLRKSQRGLEDLQDGLLPVTPFQEKSARLKPMHLLIDIPGINHSRLEAAWALVLETHITLRSMYVAHEDRVYQAFLRRQDTVSIPIKRCEEPVHEFAAKFCDQDVDPVLNGQPWWSMTRIDNKTDSVLVLRMTHAQMDALTLDVLFKDFMAAFEGRELSQRDVEFPDYMQSRLRHNASPATIEFWSKFLHGSHITRPMLLDPSSDVHPENEAMVFVSKQVPMVTPPLGITVASVFRAAWAFVLSRYAEQEDIVFGEFVEGRSLLLNGVEKITGCMAAETPMRISITPRASVRDLLRHSQEQYVARIPYETCELEDIIPHTSWPSGTEFSHILVIEKTQLVPPLVLDGRPCQHKWAFHGRLEDVHVQLIPGADTLHVGMSGPEIRLSKRIATELVEKLAATIRQFNDRPEALLDEIQCETGTEIVL
ncbi:nonribosomal peptide synthetase fmqC [Aspergillus thermomutatus]|uniref:Carrier domain-containing protein n=1 Tax=Aspergillus thermomutatus TaxID=41047 RepID=A0A397GFH0_ASPTH|nr:uncharacterized protein CDV56_104151 [Aspergillus thermomutatus]RHZ49217.1 hypothetical protein CDV56_104151 [Aspergillus thermomutatus]